MSVPLPDRHHGHQLPRAARRPSEHPAEALSNDRRQEQGERRRHLRPVHRRKVGGRVPAGDFESEAQLLKGLDVSERQLMTFTESLQFYGYPTVVVTQW